LIADSQAPQSCCNTRINTIVFNPEEQDDSYMICVGSSTDIVEGQSKGLDIDGAYLFAVKKDNQIYLYRNSCPHLGTPLEWEEDTFLDPDGTLIQCATHGALFEIETGHCISGPCQGQYLRAVPFVLDNELIMVDESHLGIRTA